MASATSTTTRPTPVTATTDIRFLGFWSNAGTWQTMGCTEPGEYYQESSKYFGCSTLYTGCVNGAQTASSSGIQYCVGSSTCITQTLHSTFPAPSFDPSQKIKPICVKSDYPVFNMYRVSPTTPTPTPTPSPRPSSTPPSSRPSASLPASQTSSTTPSATSPATPPPQPVSPGVIAGASIAGVALLLVLAFLVWFFGFHRRKQKRQQGMSYQQEQQWNQTPELVQTTYEADTSYARGVPGSYAPVQQDPHESWKYGHVNQVSELAAEGRGRG